LTATAGGFKPVTLQAIVVQTARSTNVEVNFQLAGVSESVTVAGRTSVVETTSSTVSTTVTNAQIAKLPLSGRNILDFALLVPGATQSTGGRDSHFNGLPGGAINITLDGINNNSQRFRSGGTSMFVFAPVRLGAIEEVTSGERVAKACHRSRPGDARAARALACREHRSAEARPRPRTTHGRSARGIPQSLHRRVVVPRGAVRVTDARQRFLGRVVVHAAETPPCLRAHVRRHLALRGAREVGPPAEVVHRLACRRSADVMRLRDA
jgi:hypothetical protein